MGYLKEFENILNKNDFVAFINLWEEYCTNDVVDGKELCEILEMTKASKLAAQFGPYAETALTLWKMIKQPDIANDVLRLIMDLETSNTPELAHFILRYLKKLFAEHKYFNEKIRLIGLRKGEKFQGAIRNYELLTHLNKGSFVFHTGGWGTGEIIEVSLIREQLVVEFEYVVGRKDLPFEQAFKNLVPLPLDHFLSRRFGDPDKLEEEARRSPLQAIHLLLRDLGPKTAQEIKEELYELVIPEKDWSKWWQGVRAKLKKDTFVETPANIRLPFKLRKDEISHEEQLIKKLDKKTNTTNFIQTLYNFLRDFSETLKKPEFKEFVKNQIQEKLSLDENLSLSQKLQLSLLFQDHFANESTENPVEKCLEQITNYPKIVNEIPISGLKKRALVTLKNNLANWKDIFASLLLEIEPNSLKEYIFEELYTEGNKEILNSILQKLFKAPVVYPETFVWYFQKITSKKDIPFNSPSDQCQSCETFLVLLSQLERDPQYKTTVKKMISMLSQNKYSLVRKLLKIGDEDFAKEFLLLISKSHSLTKQDVSILQSLTEAEFPSLTTQKDSSETAIDYIWTTQDGYNKLQEHIRRLATVETVENAKEIEAARALGDLRENAEFKSALERRSQLQAQLRLLSDQLNKARVITNEDVSLDEVSIGSIVTVDGPEGEKTYTILGPWDADTEKNILSFQSKFAQSMMKSKKGDSFAFQGKTFVVKEIANYLA